MADDRYLRHNLIDWFSQETLAGTRVVVIGAGAVGNEVLKNLALLGVGFIRVYDFDRIEAHNLTRSVLFRETDLGQNKADVAAARAAELDPNITVEGIAADFWDHLSLKDLQTFNLVLCCVDNFEARIRSNVLCRIAGVDFVNAGIDSRFAVIEQYPFSSADGVACFECNLPPSVYGRIADRYSCGHLRKRSFVERKIPTTIITSTAAASLAVSVGLRLGSDAGDSARRYYLDTIGGTLTRTDLDRVDDCPCCARYAQTLRIVACQSTIGTWPGTETDQTSVVTSDPILAGYRIGSAYTPVFERASRFEDSIVAAATVCSVKAPASSF